MNKGKKRASRRSLSFLRNKKESARIREVKGVKYKEFLFRYVLINYEQYINFKTLIIYLKSHYKLTWAIELENLPKEKDLFLDAAANPLNYRSLLSTTIRESFVKLTLKILKATGKKTVIKYFLHPTTLQVELGSGNNSFNILDKENYKGIIQLIKEP